MQRGFAHATITVRLRSVVWFAGGMAVAMIAVVSFAGVRGSALPSSEESTFVPITPCRLFDTRTEADFNVGPRDTPIGQGETHRQPVTGTHGRCDVPIDATGVALNVTAVNPTADSFLTVYPFDAELPITSNLNYLVGSPPTPNKVDVRVSSDGELGIYNAFGSVDVLADVTGYYTAAGLQDLLAVVSAKANAADVYTKPQTDAALAGKADKTSVYTKSEIDGRTRLRSMSFPASGLNLPDHPGVGEDGFGLVWDYDDDPVVRVSVRRPADWTGNSAVTFRMFFTRTPSPGNVRIRVVARSFDPGDDTDTLALVLPTPPQGEPGSNIARELSHAIFATDLAGAWWDVAIIRQTGSGDDYVDPLFVRAVELEYESFD